MADTLRETCASQWPRVVAWTACRRPLSDCFFKEIGDHVSPFISQSHSILVTLIPILCPLPLLAPSQSGHRCSRHFSRQTLSFDATPIGIHVHDAPNSIASPSASCSCPDAGGRWSLPLTPASTQAEAATEREQGIEREERGKRKPKQAKGHA